MYKLLLLASIENVRFKGGIYTIAKALLRKSELFKKKGWSLNYVSTCQVKNRKIANVGRLHFLNLYNLVKVILALLKKERQSQNDVWYGLASTGFGFVKDVIICFAGNIFYPKIKKVLNIQFSQPEMVIPKNYFLRKMVSWMLNHAVDLILVQTPTMKKEMEVLIYDGKIKIIDNFVSSNEQKTFNEKINRKTLNLLYLAMISRRKGFHLVLELMRRLKNEPVLLQVAGDFLEKDLEKDSRKIIQENELSSKIVFHGFIEGQKKREVIHQSDVFILLSEGEGMAMALLECMDAGLALVISDIESNRRVVGVQIPTFAIQDLDEIEKYIRILLNNSDVLSLQKQYSKEASKRFSIDAHIDLLCQYFDKVTSVVS